MFKLFKKSGRQQLNDSVLQQKYALHFNSSRLFKGVFVTTLGLLLLTTSMVAFQHLLIDNSIFVTLFVVFSSALVPLFGFALSKGKGFLVCEKKKHVWIRSMLAVLILYLNCSLTFWITNLNNSIFTNLDALCVPLIVYWMFRKKLSSIAWFGLIISFLGLSTAYSFQMDFLSFQGIIELALCIIGVLAAAGQIVTSCYIIRHDPPLRQVLYTCFTGALFSGAAVLFSGWQTPEFADLIYMIIQGLVYAGVALLYLKVCDCIEPHVIASLNYLIPIVIISINGFYGLYPMGLLKWAGCFLMLLGVVMVTVSTRLKSKEEDMFLA